MAALADDLNTVAAIQALHALAQKASADSRYLGVFAASAALIGVVPKEIELDEAVVHEIDECVRASRAPKGEELCRGGRNRADLLARGISSRTAGPGDRRAGDDLGGEAVPSLGKTTEEDDMADDIHTGGCQCGAVRFRVEGKLGDASVCHCRMCQKASGNFYLPLVSVRGAKVTWTRGERKRFQSSNFVWRGFCGDCGTRLPTRRRTGWHWR